MQNRLTGAEPPSAMELAVDDTLKLPRSLSSVDRDIRKVILKGISVKPSARYASAEELAQALDGRKGRRTGVWRLLCGTIAAIALILVSVVLLTNGGR